MTITFWPIAILLVILALCFVLYPLAIHRRRSADVDNIRHQNLQVYRARLAELDAEKEAGNLDAFTWQQMKEELSAGVLDDIKTATTTAGVVSGRRWAWAVAIASILIIPLGALLLYQDWGAGETVAQTRLMREIQSIPAAHNAQRSVLAESLRGRLEKRPDNLQGWSLLGQTYMELEDYPEAAAAYQQLAVQMQDAPKEAAIAWGLAAQARFFASHGTMSEPVQTAIDQALERDPNEVNALGLLGIHAFEQKAYDQAIHYWGKIMEVAPDHPQSDAIRQGLVQAYKRLGKPVPAALAAPAGASVIVRVTLAEKFQDQVAPDTTLFVYARAAQGSPMPLAVAKLTAAQLPVTLTLDDTMAMTPKARLSDAKRILLGGRLSKSGDVQASKGGWQGLLAKPIDLQDYDGKPVPLEIDSLIR